jgi:hypothetical protein
MAKAILQSVGEDTIAFNDQCYWVAENVKRFLNSFQPGSEVDVTVKDVDGQPMVTFLKKAGFPSQPSAPRPAYNAPQTGFGGRSFPPNAPKPTPAPSSGGMDANALYTLASVIAVAYNVNADEIRAMVATLKRPPTPPPAPVPKPAVIVPPPMAQPPQMPEEYQ